MKPLCIAHRGCHWEAFENTKEAFEAAAKGDFYGIEMDIHLTKDKKWIIHHDPDFLSNGKKIIIKNETREDLAKMPLDNEWNYKAFCPTLEDYLKIVKGSGKRPIIEIKPKNPPIFRLAQAIKIVKKYFDLKDVTFIAFYPWPLLKIRLMHPHQDIQQLVPESYPKMLNIAKIFKFGLDAESVLINQDIINEYHKKGLKVNAWTVDEEKEVKRLTKLDIDFITTNKFDQNL